MKHFLSIILVIALMIGCSAFAFAIEAPGGDTPNASLYLDSYNVDLVAIGNGEMSVGMEVIATGTMTKVGTMSLFIEQKINGSWEVYDTVLGITHSDFYMYNTNVYLGEYTFNGVAGRQYRVTMTAYARNSTGSDTGVTYSNTAICQNP